MEGIASLRSIWVIGADTLPDAAVPLMEAMPPRTAAIAATPVSPGDTLAIIYTAAPRAPQRA